ncbi:transcriptional regulator [Luteibacter pinisoli]|uniref:Transcriptional regulator n=1 Tax=Luteibacter pinisoli TaxID=2589080 RepID=A0A4Y5Z7B6_9GAMM|nr:transcriptional regulator [Luteibacter pinisoli]QDE41201.1 transcriptional regulator [Luteibacter pinisoli]
MPQQSITLPSQLAAALRDQRARLRLTQASAAASVGLLAKTISALESTPERSSIGSLLKLLAALDLQLVLETRGKRSDTGSEW